MVTTIDEKWEPVVHNEQQRTQDLQLQQEDEWLDEALRETFPASDPIASFRREPQTRTRNDADPQGPTDS